MMEAAVKQVMDGDELRPTAEIYNIDKMTLRLYVFKFKDRKSYNKFSPVYHLQVFNEGEEKTFADFDKVIKAQLWFEYNSVSATCI